MADLDKLMAIDGAVGAFCFSAKGELEAHKIADDSNLTESALDLLCHVCVANMAIATMQARGWEQMTGMQGFYPINGFTFVGFEWTAVVNDECGVVLPNDKADVEAAYAALAS